MTTRVQITPRLLARAVGRSGVGEDRVTARFPGYPKWLAGEADPTFKQLDDFATYVHVPLGCLFLPEPPQEEVPLPDFRTLKNVGVSRPSPDLLDTIYASQIRQDWYREYMQAQGIDPLPFVGSVTTDDDPARVAGSIRAALKFETKDRAAFRRWPDARNYLIEAIENLGVLVMVNGVVGNDTHRKLDPAEFRGFAIADSVAPLIFVNGADTKAAQIFTVVHEFAHVWAGDTALSDAGMAGVSSNAKEIWANKVAGEVLVPRVDLTCVYRGSVDDAELQRLAGVFKASTLVVLKRIFDCGYLTWDDYQTRYQKEVSRIVAILADQEAGGGNYYRTQPIRVSRNLARAVISSTRGGRTLYREAYSLLDTPRHNTFERLAQEVMA